VDLVLQQFGEQSVVASSSSSRGLAALRAGAPVLEPPDPRPRARDRRGALAIGLVAGPRPRPHLPTAPEDLVWLAGRNCSSAGFAFVIGAAVSAVTVAARSWTR